MTERPEISVVIPNWNGERLISRCLSAVQHSARRSGRRFEIVVVDDASNDESCALIGQRFPDVQLLVNETNLGFGRTTNRGVEAAAGALVIFFNNDMVCSKDCIARLTAHFDDDDQLFGVSALTVDWESHEPNHAWMAGCLEQGRFRLRWDHPQQARPAMFLQGGGCAIRRDRWRELGGFDPIFEPGYWEDYDLSMRALGHGWKILYDPAATAYHFGKASFSARYGPGGARQLARRNRFLFTWLNLSGKRGVLSLPRQLAGETRRGDRAGVRAFFQALSKWREVVRGRRKRLAERQKPEAELFSPFENVGQLGE